MTREETIKLIFDEIWEAEAKFPGWPGDCVHGAAILAEETGEVVKAALDYYYGRQEDIENLKKEIIQTAAMAIRFLINLTDLYEFMQQGEDHGKDKH